MATITISLPSKLKTYIDDQVSREGFGTVSEYVRSIIREDQKQKAQMRLEALLMEGLESGPATPMTDQDWVDIRREVHRRHEERKRPRARK